MSERFNTMRVMTAAMLATVTDRMDFALGGLEASGVDIPAEGGASLMESISDPEQAAADLRELADLIELHEGLRDHPNENLLDELERQITSVVPKDHLIMRVIAETREIVRSEGRAA